MNALLDALPGAVGAVVLLFLGAWENDRRTPRTEARKEAAADRAALEAQADEFVAAVLAVKVAGNTHDHLYAGWSAKGTLIIRALVGGSAAYHGSPQRGIPAAMAASQAVHTVIGRWDERSAASAAALAAPLADWGRRSRR
ncbi:hypothetical protein [Streptomyces sp. NPDC048612]|uniref:hypothetical protein n=1 Tax=Streptomyces sp. NPDC048612 TaxID=3365579 RepID=UPI00372374EA